MKREHGRLQTGSGFVVICVVLCLFSGLFLSAFVWSLFCVQFGILSELCSVLVFSLRCWILLHLWFLSLPLDVLSCLGFVPWSQSHLSSGNHSPAVTQCINHPSAFS